MQGFGHCELWLLQWLQQLLQPPRMEEAPRQLPVEGQELELPLAEGLELELPLAEELGLELPPAEELGLQLELPPAEELGLQLQRLELLFAPRRHLQLVLQISARTFYYPQGIS